ncbi:hypothetical protein ONS95_007502 [Cadophora gregata]|uniref:uncharacterized protein n=1 Tax=Cadophora gregata TaxID=51156 RepID=UPI0026DDC6CB|nr:uncharacterized protein ONS95_007502 [Cadophora gregata]KAK0118618.1 hypothetical protein ONS96_011708 [Cadophora gregata f. sp. sojae]KAK0125874.1 hypothetical protein ONS95_007502 [Cadophora gregata]
MASYNAPSSSTDKSSSWSDWTWDQRGFWVSSRYGPSGTVEYDYKFSETPQTSKQDQATPRTADTDYIKHPENLNFSYESFDAGSYATPEDQVQARYTTNFSSSIQSQSASSYRHTPSSYAKDDNEYATSSVRQEWSASGGSNTASQPSQNYGTADLPTRLTGLNINKTTPFQQQSYALPGNYQPNTGKSTSRAASFTGGELDERYKVVDTRNQKKFWQVGRVFMVLWTEPAGIQCTWREKGNQYGSQLSTTYLNGTAYTEIRRFVVIGEGYGNSICSPIHTYSGQATLKGNLPDAKQHAIIHTSKRAPEEHSLQAEDGTIIKENLPKEPIRVNSEQMGEEGDLGVLSRVNYAKIYTVEHYVRVLNIGKVHPMSMPSLEKNCMFTRRVDEPPQPPRGQSLSSKKDATKKKSSTKPSSSRKHSSKHDD